MKGLPPALEETLQKIKEDRTSGARELATKACVYILNWLERGPEDPVEEAVSLLAQRLLEVQPSMAPFLRLSYEMERVLKGKGGSEGILVRVKNLLTDFLKELRGGARGVALRFASVIKAKRRVMTHSFSTTVLEALLLIRPEEVICPESRPLCEGIRTAKELGGKGVRTVVIVDAAAPGMVAECDAVIVGADSLTSKGVVNKVGTYPLALSAKREGVPFYVLAERYKVLPPSLTPHFRIEEKPPDEVTRERVPLGKVRNRYFETTPFDLITGIVMPGTFYTGGQIERLITGREGL